MIAVLQLPLYVVPMHTSCIKYMNVYYNIPWEYIHIVHFTWCTYITCGIKLCVYINYWACLYAQMLVMHMHAHTHTWKSLWCWGSGQYSKRRPAFKCLLCMLTSPAMLLLLYAKLQPNQVHCKSLLWLSHLVPLFSLLLPTPFLILCAFYLWNNIGMHVVAVWMSGRVMCSCIPVWYHILCGSARLCSILSAWSANNAHPPCSRSRFTPGENAIQSEWL